MKRTTISIPDDPEAGLERYLAEQSAAPSLTAVVQAALRDNLQNAVLAARGYHPPSQPSDPRPLEEKDDAGEPDVSENHGFYIGKP